MNSRLGQSAAAFPWRRVGGGHLIVFPALPRVLDRSLVNLDAATPRRAFHKSNDDLITGAQQRLLVA